MRWALPAHRALVPFFFPARLIYERRSVFSYLLDFLYPPRCAACATRLPIGARRRVCQSCLERIERLGEPMCAKCGIPLEHAVSGHTPRCVRCLQSPPHFRIARAIARYRVSADDDGGTLGSIIRRHKYGLDQSLARALAECLGEELPIDGESYDLVIPVPLHRRRLRWRGFNQAALLAAELSRRLNRPMDVTTLVRIKSTMPQTAQDLETRRRNVSRAFAITKPSAIANRTVLLVDDVMTTGATADECARVLVNAGARCVDVFTLARAL
jgi:ComF family protein